LKQCAVLFKLPTCCRKLLGGPASLFHEFFALLVDVRADGVQVRFAIGTGPHERLTVESQLFFMQFPLRREFVFELTLTLGPLTFPLSDRRIDHTNPLLLLCFRFLIALLTPAREFLFALRSLICNLGEPAIKFAAPATQFLGVGVELRPFLDEDRGLFLPFGFPAFSSGLDLECCLFGLKDEGLFLRLVPLNQASFLLIQFLLVRLTSLVQQLLQISNRLQELAFFELDALLLGTLLFVNREQ